MAVGGATPGAMPRVWPSSQVATTTAGGRLVDRHMPGGRRPLGLANVGETEDRGQMVWRIKEDLMVYRWHGSFELDRPQGPNLTKVGTSPLLEWGRRTSPLQRTNGDGSRWRLSAGGAICRRTAAASA